MRTMFEESGYLLVFSKEQRRILNHWKLFVLLIEVFERIIFDVGICDYFQSGIYKSEFERIRRFVCIAYPSLNNF
jgi:hypothetical protein